jgi:glycosyltransferase involved in cell wall biosynthesis
MNMAADRILAAGMVRICHLLDEDADFETARSSSSLARAAGEGFEITRKTIGRGGTWRDVATGAASFRRRTDEQYEIVHAWGGAALTVAALAGKAPILFSPSPETHPRTVRWLRAVMDYRRVEVVTPTTTLRRALVHRGVPIEQCHLIRPGVEFAKIRARKRDPQLRARLGLTDDDYVLLAAGESTRAASHVEAVWAASILYVAYAKYKIVAWGRGPGRQSVINFANKTMPGALRDAQRELGQPIEFEDLLPAADMVVVTARRPVATLPIAICMAGAMPIVSTVTPTVAELLEDRHTALMTTGRPRQIARRTLDLVEDPTLQWQLADMARTEAYEYFSFTRFVNQFRAVYRQMAAGEKVDVPQDAPGAGLRFHGRG